MGQSWVGEEISGCDLGDARLNRRLGAILEVIGERPGKSLPTAFQDWANTKAAYRFFANGNVSEDKIAHSGGIRSPVPILSGQSFQFYPVGNSGASGHLFSSNDWPLLSNPETG